MNSNLLRLTVGWVFLMGMTAAGTYYAADEVDHRFGLEKYAIHEKFGYARATLASVTNGSQTPASPVNPPVAPPSSPSSVAPPNQPPANPVSPQPFPPNSYQSQTNPTYPPPRSPSAPQQNFPSRAYQQPPYQQQPNYQRPPQQQQPPQYSQQQNPPPQYQQPPPRQPSNGRLAQFGGGGDPALRDRLTDVESRAEAVYAEWLPIKRSLESSGQALRPEIGAALSSLQRFTQQAKASYQAGDNAGAAHAMDMAEKQMQILQKARDE